MNPNDFLQLARKENAMLPSTHDLEPGLTDEEFVSWRNRHPGVCLPDDLILFLRQCNGFRLYPDPETPTGAVRLLPLREIEYAPRLLYAGNTNCDDRYPPFVYALTDDPDSAQHLVLDTATGRYFDVDPIAGMEDEGLVGHNWPAGLDWIAKRAGLGRLLSRSF